MDRSQAYRDVVDIVRRSGDAPSGWQALCVYIEANTSRSIADSLRNLSLEDDVAQVKSQLRNVLDSEPPPPDIDAFWFGLFDTIDENKQEGIGYYVAGVIGFDPDDPDSLCSPVWWPEGRYLKSTVLQAIKEAELGVRSQGRSEDVQFLAYAGQLGAVLLVSKHAALDLIRHTKLVVGFDSGDFAEVAA